MAIKSSSEFYYRQWKQMVGSSLPKTFVNTSFSLREDIHSLKDLRIAAVLDSFSEMCYEYECSMLNLDGEHFMEELQEFKPDMFLFESAWRGKDMGWRLDVRTPTAKLHQVVAWCRARHIPVVFWNKEDPVHTDVVQAVQVDRLVLFPEAFLLIGKQRPEHLLTAARVGEVVPVDSEVAPGCPVIRLAEGEERAELAL